MILCVSFGGNVWEGIAMDRQRKEGTRMEQWSKRFGAQVRLRRVELGFQTQQALAESLGFATHGTISQIEMGNVAANFEVACELAKALQISLDDLLGLERRPGPPMPDWLSEMLMVRLPARVQDLWAPPAQQEILVQMLESMVRAMRETMAPPTPARRPQGETSTHP